MAYTLTDGTGYIRILDANGKDVDLTDLKNQFPHFEEAFNDLLDRTYITGSPKNANVCPGMEKRLKVLYAQIDPALRKPDGGNLY